MRGDVFSKPRTTKQQIRKHYSQMSKIEKDYLLKSLKKLPLNKTKISTHLIKKLNFQVNKDILIYSIENCGLENIIEYNERMFEGWTDKRVLIRSNEDYEVQIINKKTEIVNTEKCNICLVVSLIENKIVTAYWNLSSDNHLNVNMNKYNKDLKIIKY